MDAIEFVKKYGKAVAVNLHNKSQGCKLSEVLFYDSKNDKYECVDSEDLEQIVDAFELVESKGGVERSTEILYTWAFMLAVKAKVGRSAEILSEDYDFLKHALELVEKFDER